jgi:cysteine desulfurase
MRRHVITTAIEHPSVLEPFRQLEREGVSVTIVPVDGDGVVDPEEVRRALRPETVLVSVMHANNETGAVQPITEIAAIVKEAREQGQNIRFHCDGIQAPGRIRVSMEALGVDFYSMSGHKLYGPKGVGVLFARKSVSLSPVQFGGRQEHAKRPGTENVMGGIAFAAALELASTAERLEKLKRLRDHFERKLLNELGDISIVASGAERLPNTSNVYFDGVDGGSLVIALDLKGFAISSGSACSSGSIEPSHVLIAMGKSPKKARQCVRFSMGYGNTVQQVDELVDALVSTVRQFRARRQSSSAQRSISGVPA